MSDITFSNEQLSRYSQIFHNDERPLNPYNNNNLTVSQVNVKGRTYNIQDASSRNMLDEFYDSANKNINLYTGNNEPDYDTDNKKPKILINSSLVRGSQESRPGSDLEAVMILAKDKDGADRSWISHVSRGDGPQGMRVETKRGNIENYFELLLDSNGNRVVALSNPAAWRKALGFGTDIYASTVYASEIITPASNVTIDGVWYNQRHNIAMLRLEFHFGTNLSNIPVHGNHGDIAIGTIVAGKRPLVSVHPHSNGEWSGPAWYHLATNGALSLCATEGRGSVYQLNSGSRFTLFTSYIVA